MLQTLTIHIYTSFVSRTCPTPETARDRHAIHVRIQRPFSIIQMYKLWRLRFDFPEYELSSPLTLQLILLESLDPFGLRHLPVFALVLL